MTAADAERYYKDYKTRDLRDWKRHPPDAASTKPRYLDQAFRADPRYSRAQSARAMNELLPR